MNKIEAGLYKHVRKCLMDYNLNYIEDNGYFIVNTRFGKWRVRPEHMDRSKLVTIFTRFDEPENINRNIFKRFSYNNFSGKLNFHYWNKDKGNMLKDFDMLCGIVAARVNVA